MPEFTVEKHGANHWLVYEDGQITDMRVSDKGAGDAVVRRIHEAFGAGAGAAILGGEQTENGASMAPAETRPDWHAHVIRFGETEDAEDEIRLHHSHAHQLDDDPRVDHGHAIRVELGEDGAIVSLDDDAAAAADRDVADESVVTLDDIRRQLLEYSGVLDLEDGDARLLQGAIDVLSGDVEIEDVEDDDPPAGDTAETDSKPDAPAPSSELPKSAPAKPASRSQQRRQTAQAKK